MRTLRSIRTMPSAVSSAWLRCVWPHQESLERINHRSYRSYLSCLSCLSCRPVRPVWSRRGECGQHIELGLYAVYA